MDWLFSLDDSTTQFTIIFVFFDVIFVEYKKRTIFSSGISLPRVYEIDALTLTANVVSSWMVGRAFL